MAIWVGSSGNFQTASATLAVNLPAGTQPGDLAFLIASSDSSADPAFGTPSGWTFRTKTAATNMYTYMFTRILQAGDTSVSVAGGALTLLVAVWRDATLGTIGTYGIRSGTTFTVTAPDIVASGYRAHFFGDRSVAATAGEADTAATFTYGTSRGFYAGNTALSASSGISAVYFADSNPGQSGANTATVADSSTNAWGIQVDLGAGTAGTNYTRTVNDTIGVTDTRSITIVYRRTLSDSIGTTDTVQPVKTSGGTVLTRTVNDKADLADVVRLTIMPAPIQVADAGLSIKETVIPVYEVEIGTSGILSFLEDISIDDSLTVATLRTFSDTGLSVTGIPSVQTTIGAAPGSKALNVFDGISLRDSLTVTTSRSVSDTGVKITDPTPNTSLYISTVIRRTINDLVDVTTYSYQKTYLELLSSTFTLPEALLGPLPAPQRVRIDDDVDVTDRYTISMSSGSTTGRPKVQLSSSVWSNKPAKVWTSGNVWVEKPYKSWTGSIWKTAK